MMKDIGSYHSGKGHNKFHRQSTENDSIITTYDADSGVRYFGMEVEMEFNRNRPKDPYLVASDLSDETDDCPYYDMFRLESDGSLTNGFELITDALDFEVMKRFIANCEFLRKALRKSDSGYPNGYNSRYNDDEDNYDEGNSCGVHVHVSHPFGHLDFDDPNRREFSNKIVALIAMAQSQLAQKTRCSSYGEWYFDSEADISIDSIRARLLNEDDDSDELLRDRYKCVNFTNSRTIEFRFFNHTKYRDRLIEYIKFVNNIMDYAESHTLGECLGTKIEMACDEDSFSFTAVVETVLTMSMFDARVYYDETPIEDMTDVRNFNRTRWGAMASYMTEIYRRNIERNSEFLNQLVLSGDALAFPSGINAQYPNQNGVIPTKFIMVELDERFATMLYYLSHSYRVSGNMSDMNICRMSLNGSLLYFQGNKWLTKAPIAQYPSRSGATFMLKAFGENFDIGWLNLSLANV